jgi:hypothetical protein
MHSVDLLTFITVVNNINICKPFKDGDGNGFYVGVSYENFLGKDADKANTSIIARLLFSTLPATLEKEQDHIPSLVYNPTTDQNDIVYTSTKHDASVTYNLICGEVMFKLNPIPGITFGITAGPTFDFPITKTIRQTYSLLGEPYNARFIGPQTAQEIAEWQQNNWMLSDDKRTITVKDGPIEDAASFRLGIKIGLQYEIITSKSWYIVPSIYYNWGLTKVTSKEDWRVNALQAGVDIRFAL